MPGLEGDPGFGLYIHIPFCRHRCDYCAFAAWDDRDHLTERYMAALSRDLAYAVAQMPRPASSIFVGGGTPSRVGGEVLGALLASVPVAADAEVTVEVNPEDATDELFDHYRAAGVNRISLGVQSMAPDVLASLGRVHRLEAVTEAVEAVRRAGFASFNLDLIYGAAGESLDSWTSTLAAILTLNPPHVSAYALTVEPGTPLATDTARHPDDDDQAAKYAVTDEMLGAAGLQWYEISNWSRPGHECRHNQLYWAGGSYFGVGCGAHSHHRASRWWNIRTPERYAAAVEAGDDLVAGRESLDPPQRRLERLQLAVRTRAGVPLGTLPQADVDGVLADLVAVDSDRMVLTLRGRLLANEVALRLV